MILRIHSAGCQYHAITARDQFAVLIRSAIIRVPDLPLKQSVSSIGCCGLFCWLLLLRWIPSCLHVSVFAAMWGRRGEILCCGWGHSGRKAMYEFWTFWPGSCLALGVQVRDSLNSWAEAIGLALCLNRVITSCKFNLHNLYLCQYYWFVILAKRAGIQACVAATCVICCQSAKCNKLSFESHKYLAFFNFFTRRSGSFYNFFFWVQLLLFYSATAFE